MLDIPVIVRNKALAAGAEQWARGPSDSRRRPRTRLVDRRREAARGWYRGFRHRSHVRRRNSGSLKLLARRPVGQAEHEITALRLAKGGDCARLLNEDADRGALLLERLGPSLFESQGIGICTSGMDTCCLYQLDSLERGG